MAKQNPRIIGKNGERRTTITATQRLRQQKSNSSLVAYLPIGVGVLILGIALAVVWHRIMPDTGEADRQKALALYKEEKYSEALWVLRNAKTSNDETAEKITQLKHEVQLRLEERSVDEMFTKRWQEEYVQPLARGELDRDQQRKILVEFLKQYGRTKYRDVVRDEFTKYRQGGN